MTCLFFASWHFACFQIQQVRETFPSMSKESAALVLQTCDCNLEKAVTMISQGELSTFSYDLA